MKSDAVLSEVRKLVCCLAGTRQIVVLHRGWIFVGDLSFDEAAQQYTLRNVKNIRRWETGGFGGLTKSASGSGAVLDGCADVLFAPSAMIFSVPIGEDWDA